MGPGVVDPGGPGTGAGPVPPGAAGKPGTRAQLPAARGDFTWAPGNWVWVDNRYAWQPGYWVPAQPNWVWTPSSYSSTPNGYLYNSGYWDYSVAQRGQLFAPMYFQQPSYLQPNFAFTPSIGLLGAGLLSSLFIRPQYHQYYFGDYYGANNFQSGIYPYYAYHQSRYGYDPIYAQAAAIQGRNNPQWASQIHDQYVYRREHPEARPARTYAEQRTMLANNPNLGNTSINNTTINNVRNVMLARPLGQMAARTAPAAGGPRRCGSSGWIRPVATSPSGNRRSCSSSASSDSPTSNRPPARSPRRSPGRPDPSPGGSTCRDRRSRPSIRGRKAGSPRRRPRTCPGSSTPSSPGPRGRPLAASSPIPRCGPPGRPTPHRPTSPNRGVSQPRRARPHPGARRPRPRAAPGDAEPDRPEIDPTGGETLPGLSPHPPPLPSDDPRSSGGCPGMPAA